MKKQVKQAVLSLNKESSHVTRGLNTLSLVTVSLLWGHMLGLVSWWLLPVTVLIGMAAYGCEIHPRKNNRITF